MFTRLLDTLSRPLTVLDVGGTSDFWSDLKFSNEGVKVLLMNLKPVEIGDPRLEPIVGDARDLSAFGDGSVDVVYSNSVIEHVGALADQRMMASEVRRVAKRYFVQTPNAYFPIEPHFLVPGFQFMPLSVRAFLLTRFRLGWVARQADLRQAREIVASVKLLTPSEVRDLFPEATYYRERFLGLTKSIVAYYGW